MMLRGILCASVMALCACATAPVPAPDRIETPIADTSVPVDLSVRAVATLSDDVFDLSATLDLAEAAFAAGDVDTAFKHYKTSLMAAPDNARGLLGYGNAALALGLGEAAHSAFAKLPPDRAPHISGLVLAEIMTGRSDDIELRLNEALEQDQTDPRLWNALGQFFDSIGRPLLAQDNYIRALSTGRASAAAVNNLGQSYLMTGRIDDAKAKFMQARDMDPARDLYDNNLRLALAMSGDYDGAAAGLSGMRAAHILNDAGVIARARGDDDVARALFKKAIETAPRHHVRATENLTAMSAP